MSQAEEIAARMVRMSRLEDRLTGLVGEVDQLEARLVMLEKSLLVLLEAVRVLTNTALAKKAS